MIEAIRKDAQSRMRKTIESMRSDLAKIRTGRATPSLLEHIQVDYYGVPTPLNQVAKINIEDSRTLNVTPWEKNLVSVIEKAVMNADLGLNPFSAGTVIRVPMPPLTEERRKDLVRVVRQEAEAGRVAIRNIRRDANSMLKLLVKDKEISEDDERRAQEAVQKLTDQYITKADGLLIQKERELMEV